MSPAKQHRTPHLTAAILLILLLFTGTVSAGAFVIDTSSITGTVNQKITVPVIVQNAENMCGYQLTISGDRTAADIVFNKTSVAHGFSYDDGTGIIIWTGYSQNPFQKITGTQEVFSLDITPKKSGSVSLAVTVSAVQAGENLDNANPVSAYQGSTATLTVSGSSQEPITPPVNPDTPQNPITPPVNPDTPQNPVTPPVTPNTPMETPQETPNVPTETPSDETPDTPDVPDDIVPTIPVTPEIPVAPSSSPIPLIGILAGFGAAVALYRKFI